MLLEIYNAIQAVLVIAKGNLLTNSDLILTVPEAVPREIQSYDFYVSVIGYRPVTFSQEPSTGGSQKPKEVAVTVPLDIFAPQVGEDYTWREITNMMTVVDGILDEFNQRPGLEDSDWRALRYLNPNGQVILNNAIMDVQPYPTGTVDYRHHWSVDINVPYLWTCPGNRA